jgi:hypothetical protein
MCEKMVSKEDVFIPYKCLLQHGTNASHKICKDCWWNSKNGFALESANHKCPGCQKKLPLSKREEPIIVDLTGDIV